MTNKPSAEARRAFKRIENGGYTNDELSFFSAAMNARVVRIADNIITFSGQRLEATEVVETYRQQMTDAHWLFAQLSQLYTARVNGLRKALCGAGRK
jgi:hypothetical protein